MKPEGTTPLACSNDITLPDGYFHCGLDPEHGGYHGQKFYWGKRLVTIMWGDKPDEEEETP